MGPFKAFTEPAVIASIFTLAAVVNRRSRRSSEWPNDMKGKISEARGSPHGRRLPGGSNKYEKDVEKVDDLSYTRRGLLSPLIANFPFLVEIGYWLLTYWVYQLARAASACHIRGKDVVLSRARDHALQVLSLERRLGLDIEVSFQSAILQYCPNAMKLFTVIYHLHIIVGVAFIAYGYTFFPIQVFQRVRRTIAVNNLIAFSILSMWRCMPPRLLGTEYGYIDILHQVPQSVWADNKFQLTIAAMPSLHFGTAAFIGLTLWRQAPRSHVPLRLLAAMYPIAMLATILATANHFVLDAVIGVLVPVIGWKIEGIILWLTPIEEWLLRILHVEKPAQTDPLILLDLDIPFYRPRNPQQDGAERSLTGRPTVLGAKYCRPLAVIRSGATRV